ncbi:unnamed protein product, partial [Mesorhabditis belari]|uniref:Uncharacterized protein n=1 Tax=Mesorhabditis belari TaxID=2138241 RepID=A0AAF3F0V4_9BILA
MKPTKIAGFYSPSDQKLHELSDFSLGSSSDFFDSEDAKHQFCLKNNTLFKFIPETGSFTQLASLPKGTFFARFLDDSLLAVNGELNVRNEKREWRRVKLRKPPKYCPHGVASTSNDKISIKSLVLGFSTFVIVDENGQLWTFERNSLLDNGNTSITPRRLPFMGGMRKCTRIVGGRKHFLALVVRSVAEQKGFDCDDIEDNISRKIQMNEVNFQNCDKCQEDGKMRLSATMKLADQTLENRFLSDSPTSSAHPTLRKKKQIFEVPDDFVEVWSWGDNSAGQLGHGDSVNRKEPFPISTLTEYHVVEIACGEQFSMALTANGEVLSWGESLQPSTSLTFNSTPQILKIGYDQIALGICAFKEQSAILISSTNGPSFILHSTKDAVTRNRSIQKLPPFVKDHICVETSVLESTLGFKTLKRSAQVEECFTFWAEAVKLGRLLRALAKMSQHMHENSRASCAEDQSAIVADLLHKFYLSTVCAAGSIAGLSASLRQLLITGESLDSVEILNRCVTSDFTNALLHYFDALCDAVAFGCFVRISVRNELLVNAEMQCL